MALPKAVQAQLDQAEQIQATLSIVATPDAGNTAAEDVAPTPPADVFNTSEDTSPEPQVAPPPKQPDPFEAKYKVLQGKYEAEVPRLHQQVRELNSRLNDTLSQLDQAKRPEPKPAEPETAVTNTDVELYGEELLDLIRRVSKSTFAALAQPMYNDLIARMAPMQDRVAKVETATVQSREERFYEAVATAVPDWKTVNVDQGFLEWLAQPVSEFSAETRQDVLNRAVATLDSATAVKLFNGYKESTGRPAPRQTLNSQVTPSKATASAPAPAQKKIWSQREYADAWDHRLYTKMSAEEVDRLRAAADLALAEGRVQ